MYSSSYDKICVIISVCRKDIYWSYCQSQFLLVNLSLSSLRWKVLHLPLSRVNKLDIQGQNFFCSNYLVPTVLSYSSPLRRGPWEPFCCSEHVCLIIGHERCTLTTQIKLTSHKINANFLKVRFTYIKLTRNFRKQCGLTLFYANLLQYGPWKF